MPFGPPQRASGVAVQTYGLVVVMSSASASNTQRPSDIGVESAVPYSSSEVNPVCPRKAAFGGAAEGGVRASRLIMPGGRWSCESDSPSFPASSTSRRRTAWSSEGGMVGTIGGTGAAGGAVHVIPGADLRSFLSSSSGMWLVFSHSTKGAAGGGALKPWNSL